MVGTRRRHRAGKVYGHGKGYFEYRIKVPSTVIKAHPESIYYLFQAASKATARTRRLAATGQPPGLSPD